jgi:esterase/lipase
MTIVASVIAVVLVFAAAAFLTVSVLAARSLVARRIARLVNFEVQSDGTVRLTRTPFTSLPGTFGLFFDDRNGHVRLGAIIESTSNDQWINREVLAATGSPLPRHGQGQWVRDAFPSPSSLGLPFEDIGITTDSGNCPAWLIPAAGDASSPVWAIHLHGIRTTRSVVLPGVAALSESGLTSLVPSWRGDSEGPATPGGTSSLGQEEWQDVEDALAFAVASGAQSVVLVGWSMGGAIAQLISRRSRFADRIAGIALIAPVTSWRLVLRNSVRSARLPAAVAPTVEVVLGSRVLCRLAGLSKPVSLKKIDADLSKIGPSIPTLVIHNPGDELVPYALTTRFISENATHSTLITFEESPHAMEWNLAAVRFERELRTWAVGLLANDSTALALSVRHSGRSRQSGT